jgi:hypothetical protein
VVVAVPPETGDLDGALVEVVTGRGAASKEAREGVGLGEADAIMVTAHEELVLVRLLLEPREEVVGIALVAASGEVARVHEDLGGGEVELAVTTVRTAYDGDLHDLFTTST